MKSSAVLDVACTAFGIQTIQRKRLSRVNGVHLNKYILPSNVSTEVGLYLHTIWVVHSDIAFLNSSKNNATPSSCLQESPSKHGFTASASLSTLIDVSSQVCWTMNSSLKIDLPVTVQGSWKFMQCLNGGSNHWITISTLGCPSSVVHIFDSLHYPTSFSVKKTIADLLHTRRK